jgi:hypothetical protein
MSAVVEFVSDAVESVVDAVGDAVEAVGDFVEDAVDFVGDTVQAIVEDPLPTLLSIAGSMVGIPPPVTMAAVTAARGGDLEDIVLSAGVAYIAPQASNALSSTLSASIGDAIVNQTVSDIVVDSVSKGLVNGTIAEIRGGDFDDGFAGAFTGSLVNSSVGEFTNEFITPSVQDMLADSGLEASTVNTLVREGTRAVSSGLTAEITGRGDFQDAFINSVQNSTINVGTNFAVNSIGTQFNNIETGLAKVDQESDKEDDRDLTSFDDYFALDTTRNTETTGAGVPDTIVEDVEVADTSTDTGSFTDTSVANLETEYQQTFQPGAYEDILTSQEDFAEAPAVSAAVTPEEEFDEYADIDIESLPADLRDLFDYTPKIAGREEEEPIGGLVTVTGLPADAEESDVLFQSGAAQYAPEEGVVPTDEFEAVTKKPEAKEDIYSGLGEETFGLPSDGTVDIAEGDVAAPDIAGTESIIEGGLNKVQQGLVDATDTSKMKDQLISGALQQVVRPAIRQGLTRAIRGTPTRPVRKQPVKPKQPLTAEQMARVRTATGAQGQPAKKIDMDKVLAQSKKPTYVPPKKVDVSKLTPVTNVASLTSILGGGKG